MKINPLLMDIVRGQWLMSFDGLATYAPIAYKILTGEDVDLNFQPKSLVTIIDDNGKKVQPDDDGDVIAPEGSVAVIDMMGPILKRGDWCTYGADEITRALLKAEQDANIIGTILNVDTPGGAVSAISSFLEFGNVRTKPLISLVDQCCSLGYWASAAISDKIIADNNISAQIGSIGVMSTFIDNIPYLETLGYKVHEIYADESPHKNEAVRLAREGKYELIKKEHLSPLALKFQSAVKNARPTLKEELGVLTGKTFGAEKSIEVGLIDAIGNLDSSINMLHIMSETKHYK